MAKVDLNRTTYVQINTVATRVQIFGGRIRVAASATPAADDFQVWPDGEIIDITAVKFAQAIDLTATWIVELPV
jgi:hypothetical protein